MDFSPNRSDLDRLFAKYSQKLGAMDDELRGKYEGQSVDDILVPVAMAIGRAGFDFTDLEVRAYVQAVSDERDFSFDV